MLIFEDFIQDMFQFIRIIFNCEWIIIKLVMGNLWNTSRDGFEEKNSIGNKRTKKMAKIIQYKESILQYISFM